MRFTVHRADQVSQPQANTRTQTLNQNSHETPSPPPSVVGDLYLQTFKACNEQEVLTKFASVVFESVTVGTLQVRLEEV